MAENVNHLTLPITGMTCANCVATVEHGLRKLEGVVQPPANLATERVLVEYIPTVLSQREIRQAIDKAGFRAVEAEGGAEDAEQLARDRGIGKQRRLLRAGVALTVPLFALSMAGDLGWISPHSLWARWVMLALATPVQFYV